LRKHAPCRKSESRSGDDEYLQDRSSPQRSANAPIDKISRRILEQHRRDGKNRLEHENVAERRADLFFLAGERSKSDLANANT
jgi:hypothetical protein